MLAYFPCIILHITAFHQTKNLFYICFALIEDLLRPVYLDYLLFTKVVKIKINERIQIRIIYESI